jgi:tRNA(Ile)-lysidine synthase
MMIDDFKRFIKDEDLFPQSGCVLLAVSGGLDSSVMAALFNETGFKFAIAHANFQLRDEESARDEEFAASLAVKYNVPFHLKRFETLSYARKNRISVQMAARSLRYTWFDELITSENYTCVATAHHMDDQVETFLLNMARGTGITGLRGILPKQGRIIRPLLFASRSRLEEFAKENDLQFVEDSSNRSEKYTRNRIRLKIIPQFEKINPAFKTETGSLMLRMREIESIYRSSVEKERMRLVRPDGVGYRISVTEIRMLAPQMTWMYELLSPFGFSKDIIGGICQAFNETPGKTFFSASHRLVVDREYLLINAIPAPVDVSADQDGPFVVFPSSAELKLPVKLEFLISETGEADLSFEQNSAFFDYENLQFPLTIRKWRKGDYFYPFGMTKKKLLSDFFIDSKYSIPQKERMWLLCSGEEIAWVIGARTDNRFRITAETKKVLRVVFSPVLL